MLIVVLGVLAFFALVFSRLIVLHLIEPADEGYKQRDYSATYELLGLRGRILDRNDQVLVESVPGRVVYIDRKDPKLKRKDVNLETLPSEISRLLNIPEERVSEAFFGERTYRGRPLTTIRLGEISDNHAIEELNRRTAFRVPAGERIAGVNYGEQISVRAHPNGARLSHVVGFINAQGQGVYGIEQRFDRELKGHNGRIEAVVDARRREIRDLRQEEIPAEHGNDIVLTIDNGVQYIIEKSLSEAIERYRASSGMILVQRVKTGEVLGMATLPSFPPEKYGLFPAELWKNIAISRNYEPGSVMKPLIVAMAMEFGVINERTKIEVKVPWFYGGRRLSDHIDSGYYDARVILAKSSNVGTAKIGLEMAKENTRLGFKEYQRLYLAFRALGFGELTGIDLVGEEMGIVPHFSRWSKLSPTRLPIGQGIAVTGIQLCTAYSALANGGYLMRPMIVKEIRASKDVNNRNDYHVVKRFEPEVRGRPFSEETAKKVIDMMTSVVEKDARIPGWYGGTGWRARLPSYRVAGKTGTAQIPVNGSYSSSEYNASFVGIYPASNPEVTILVTIERPQSKEHAGGDVAAPIFASIAEEIGHYLQLPADKKLVKEE